MSAGFSRDAAVNSYCPVKFPGSGAPGSKYHSCMESISRLFRDFRYACRSLRRSPAMATAAIATLALGIGANTAIFSVLEGVVLEPLPFPQPDHLVIVALFNRTLGYATYLSYPDFLDWQRN